MAKHFSQTPADVRLEKTEPFPKAAERIKARGHAGHVAFIVTALALLLVPLAALPLAGSQRLSSQDDQAAFPALFDDSGFNTNFLSDVGAYFEEHFAFKSQLIDADAQLRERVFGVSNTKQVIVGTDGWIYYGGTFADYQGTAHVSSRLLDNVAFNLSLAQGYTQSRGAKFLVTFAPNKNTIYPEHMPASYLASKEPHAIERLLPYLDAHGVSYVDMGSVLAGGKADGLVYCLRDSHWNDRGALLGANALLDALDVAHDAHEGAVFADEEAVGDIDAMLHPAFATAEAVPTIQGGYDFSFTGDTDDVTANLIQTAGAGSEALLMFRDSFGNRLLAPMAEAFKSATFTNLVPYDFTRVDATRADYVVVERVERHLSDLATNPPVFPAPRVTIDLAGSVDATVEFSTKVNGSYTVFDASVSSSDVNEGLVDASTGFYVGISNDTGFSETYIASHTSVERADGPSDYGLRAYIPTSSLPQGPYRASIIAQQDGRFTVISTFVVS